MPPTSEAQRGLAYAASKDPAVAERTGMPQDVAQEFVAADKPGKLPARKRKKRVHKITPA